IAEAIYAQDNQATLARWYGGALTTGLSIDDIRSWPDRIRAVTAEQVRDAARKWLEKNRSVTGYLIKDPTPKREEKRSGPNSGPARSASHPSLSPAQRCCRCYRRHRKRLQKSSGWFRPAVSRPGWYIRPPCP